MYSTESNCLFTLTGVLDPTGKVDVSRKLCSNPKRLDLRIVQPVTIQLISPFVWLNICDAPTALINRSHRDPLIIRRDLHVWEAACEEGGLHNAHERVRKEGIGTLGMDDSVTDAVKKGSFASGKDTLTLRVLESFGINSSARGAWVY